MTTTTAMNIHSLRSSQPAHTFESRLTSTSSSAEQGLGGSPDPSRDLAERASLGHEDAVRELLRKSRGPVARVVRRVLGREGGDVDDVTQDALLALYIALPAFRGDCKLTTYASRIAFRVALLARRRRALEFRRRTPVELDTVLETLEADSACPAGGARVGRQRELLEQLLRELPREQALTLVLRAAQGWSRAELAAATCVPENTVKSRLRLAKAALRRRIDGDPELRDALELAWE